MAYKVNLDRLDDIREEINEATCHREDRLIGPFTIRVPKGELGDRVYSSIEDDLRCRFEEDYDDSIAYAVSRAQKNLMFERSMEGAKSVIAVSNEDGHIRVRFRSDRGW